MERVEAPVTGSVRKVECAVGDEGDAVADGRALLVLEP